MIKIIIEYLPYLALAVAFNILTGSYNNISKLNKSFSWKKLFVGIGKALIVGICFVIFALIYDKIVGSVSLGAFELTPDTIIISSIVLYTTKGLNNLIKILGLNKDNLVELQKKETIEIPIENEIE
jgi:hypothetical protein